jgi:Lon-like protease
MLVAGFLAAAMVVLAATLPVPLVALGPGPTYDTLSDVEGKPVVSVNGLPTYPTTGHLNMTTVSVTDKITLLNALGFWASPREQVVPRSVIFPPEQTDAQVEAKNSQDFEKSQLAAESAVTSELRLDAEPVVADIVAGSAADGPLDIGDVLISIGGQPVRNRDDVVARIKAVPAGAPAAVVVRRDGAQKSVDVTPRTDDGGQPVIGVVVGSEPAKGTLSIDLGGIGGPSAGLMFSLSLYDKLTPGPLTGGRFVAGTGALDVNGDVLGIGGIQFKLRAARDAGATVFLVPDVDCADAVKAAPDGLQLVKVSSLHDAVAALGQLSAGTPAPSC